MDHLTHPHNELLESKHPEYAQASTERKKITTHAKRYIFPRIPSMTTVSKAGCFNTWLISGQGPADAGQLGTTTAQSTSEVVYGTQADSLSLDQELVGYT